MRGGLPRNPLQHTNAAHDIFTVPKHATKKISEETSTEAKRDAKTEASIDSQSRTRRVEQRNEEDATPGRYLRHLGRHFDTGWSLSGSPRIADSKVQCSGGNAAILDWQERDRTDAVVLSTLRDPV